MHPRRLISPCALLQSDRMNLSFVPGDLHLFENDGLFVVKVAGQEVIRTKSERYAIVTFHSLREKLEKRSPAREPSAQEKSELLQNEVNAHILEHDYPNKHTARISSSALFEVETALRRYYTALEATDLTSNSQATYMDQADRFVRWLRGEFDPGSRSAPYRPKKQS